MIHTDILIGVALILIVVMMVLPLPAQVLDFFLAFNFAFALVLILLTFYTGEPLNLSIFPTILLLATLLRLSLNVSSTRLILLNGYAGEVIRQFGEFVVGGNPVVGFVVFLILVTIQFVVITRGAERVAEVAARFTLDAMPGKQMSIDADLNAGLIDDQEARRRRREIEREADFYGAMDGAAKFIKGDAVAGLLILAIDLVGGVVVGTLQKGMSISEALATFSLLTVGDGLVSQIPALLIATATGIIVTRAASDADLGQELVRQLGASPKVLGIAAVMLLFLGLIPGLPRLPFLALAGLLGYVSMTVGRSRKREEAREEEQAAADGSGHRPESVLPLIPVDPLEVELGFGLLSLADGSSSGDFLRRVAMLRKQMALELGIVVPPIRVRDNVQLRPHEYAVRLHGVRVAGGELLPGHHLAMGEIEERGLDGVTTRDPAFGLPALWVSGEQKEEAELAGCTVVDPSTVLATHLTEIVRGHADELVGRQEVQTLVDSVRERHPAVVEELLPAKLGLGDVQKVIRNLLREGIPIRNVALILETLADHAPAVKDPEILTEHVRRALRRQIAERVGLGDDSAAVLILDPALEERISAGIQQDESGTRITLDPDLVQRLGRAVARETGRFIGEGKQPLVLCSPRIRPYLRKLTERAAPRLPVLSYGELVPEMEIRTAGMIKIEEQGARVGGATATGATGVVGVGAAGAGVGVAAGAAPNVPGYDRARSTREEVSRV
ncbi:MAG: flagellar biosynthesis protein FlhA [Firmicutes bacterium]|nr:flagellar biosynthesis protein FlhA [Bacillota bacterium]